MLSLLVEAGRKKESVFKEIQSRGGYENLMKTFLSADEDILLKITAISLIEQVCTSECACRCTYGYVCMYVHSTS